MPYIAEFDCIDSKTSLLDEAKLSEIVVLKERECNAGRCRRETLATKC